MIKKELIALGRNKLGSYSPGLGGWPTRAKKEPGPVDPPSSSLGTDGHISGPRPSLQPKEMAAEETTAADFRLCHMATPTAQMSGKVGYWLQNLTLKSCQQERS